MSFRVEKSEKYALIEVQTEKLNGANAPELKAHLVQLNAEKFNNIIIDLSRVKYSDSSGLSAILVGNRLCKTDGGTQVICGLQEMVEKLIKISQLTGILKITPTANEAIDFIFMEEVEKELNDEN